jgi:hypothetical protein
MAETVFVVDVAGWERAFKSPSGMLGQWVDEVSGDIEAACKFEAPGPGKPPRNRTGINYGKGVLMNRISHRVVGGGPDEIEGHIYVIPEHAKYVIHGTRPHVIRPKSPTGHLRFFWFRVGKFMVLPKVNHPGTAANDFMSRGLKKGCLANGI